MSCDSNKFSVEISKYKNITKIIWTLLLKSELYNNKIEIIEKDGFANLNKLQTL